MSDHDRQPVRPLAWMRAVRDAVPRFTRTRREVLLMLGLRMSANGTGFASGRQLGADADVGERTAERATADARRRGYLNRTRRGHRLGNGTVIASEWELTMPVDNSTQPDTRDGLTASQPDSRDISTRQNERLNPTPIGGPGGLHPEVLQQERPAGPVDIATRATGASAEEAAAVVDLIQTEKDPDNLTAFVSHLAAAGELPDWLDRVRDERDRAQRAEKLRAGWPCRRCRTRNYPSDTTCRQCGAPREPP